MKPLLLHYYLTNRCNARCVFCEIWKEQPKLDADITDVYNNLAAARRKGCSFVDFTGGEPLTYKELPEVLRKAKKLGFATSVTTNCILFEQRAHELAGLIDLLHFSLDADTPVRHNQIRGCNSFDSVTKSIAAALKNNLFPDLLFTYTNDNINDFEGVYSIARVNKLMVILDPVFSTTGPDPISLETHAIARSYAKRKGVYLNTALLLLRRQGGNNPIKTHCRAVSSTIVILPSNQLAIPCFHQHFCSLPIKNNLDVLLSHPIRSDGVKHQGEYPFCEGCHINCYFDPSFASGFNRFFFLSMIAKFRYALYKYLIYKRPFPFWPKGFFI